MRARWKQIRVLTFLCLLSLLVLAGYALLDHYKMEVYRGAMGLQQKAAGLHQRQIGTAGFDWAYLENDLKGQKPTLLQVHGFGASKENWLDLSRHLQHDFHLVLVDLPGHGETSFDPAVRYDIDDQVQRLHAFTQAIGIAQFHMIGNSMGGAISALYAATHPDNVASVMLLNPSGIFDAKSELDTHLQQGRNPLVVENADDFAFLVEFTMEQAPFIPWPLSAAATELMKQRRATNNLIFSHISGSHGYVFKDAITRITAPTLIVWGKQDRALNAANASEFQRLIPGSQVLLLDNVGHVPMLEIPAQTATMVQEWTATTAKAAR